MVALNNNERSSLEKALQENWNHARHVEILRDRYMALYWFLWAAILSYAGSRGIQQNAFLFLFLSGMSVSVLFSTLKWNAEFANHMAAIAETAIALGLNKPKHPENGNKQKPDSNAPLPYAEFEGYMAMGLRFPLPYNVGVWLAVTYCLGLGLATALFFRGWLRWRFSVLLGILATIGGLILCYRVYSIAQREIPKRLPHPE